MDETEQNIIKNAVKGESESTDSPEEIFIPSSSVSNLLQNPRKDLQQFPVPPGYEGMQPSIMTNEPDENAISQQTNVPSSQAESNVSYDYPPAGYNAQQPAYTQPEQVQDPYSQYQYAQQDNSQYPQYQSYQEGMSSDVITEISEQVVDEKLSILRDKMENAINYKNISEAKIIALDRRLRRIEQIIDTLQISLLQRVSEYVTDIKDIKTELQETQRSFKSLSPSHHHSSSTHASPPHHSSHHATYHPHHNTHHSTPSHHHTTPHKHSKAKKKHP